MPLDSTATGDDAPHVGSAWMYGLLAVGAACAVYGSLPFVWFFSDDLMHLAEIEGEPLWLVVLRPFGGHNYFVRNLVFAASWKVFGLQPDRYFWMVWLTHALNTGLLFGIIRRLVGSATLGCLGAVLWGVSPLAAGTLGWYSAYGHVLVATCLLVVLYDLCRRLHAGAVIAPQVVGAWCGILLAGTTCFGVGLGVAIGFPFVLFCLDSSTWQRRRLRRRLLMFPLLTLVVYVGLRRGFTLIEPLAMEEAFHDRTLGLGLAAFPPLLSHLIGFSVSGTLLGFFQPTEYPSPLGGGVIAAFLLGCLLMVWRGDRRTRRTALAMMVLTVTTYGAIAVGRAGVYAAFKVPPPTAAAVPRYHYAATVPIVILAMLLIERLGRRIRWPASFGPPTLLLALVFICVGWMNAGSTLLDLHPLCRDYFLRTSAEMVRTVRAAPPGADVYLENGVSPVVLLGTSLPNHLFPGRAPVFLLSNRGDSFEGHRVRFIERNPQVLAEYRARPRNRLHQLLVGPEDVPQEEKR